MNQPEPNRAEVGATMADVLALPASLRRLVTWMMRGEGCDLAEAAARLDEDDDAARAVMDELVARGFVTRVETPEGPRYRARPGGRGKRGVPGRVWGALDDLGKD